MFGVNWRAVIGASLACLGSACAADSVASIGVAVQKAGAVCLSLRNANLKASDAVTLVIASKPQSVVRAVVDSKSDAGCPGITDKAESGYLLRVTMGVAPDFQPLIAVVQSPGFRSRDGVVTAKLAGKSGTASFRSCTSAEGVHLTVWRGAALKGTRLWHEYYYLGQDLEQTCTAKDTAK